MRILRRALVFIVLAVLGVFMLVMSIKDKIALSKPPLDVATMTEADIKDGAYVEGDIYEVWTEYAELQSSDSVFGIKYNTKTDAHYFAIPLESAYTEDGPTKFLSIAVRNSSDYSTAQKMEKESLALYNEGKDLQTKIHIKGKITKLRKDASEIFDEFLSFEGFNTTNGIYYVINVGNDGSGTTATLLIAIAVFLVGALGTLIVVIRGIHRG